MEYRPKIKLELTTADKIIEIVGWLFVIAIWVFTLLHFSNLPETIPTHYNGAGKVDRFGGKVTILTLPLISTLLLLGMTIVNKYPHHFNYPNKITPENAFNQYTNATRLIRYLKLIIVFIFGLLTFKTIQNANGTTKELGFWFLPLMLGFIFIPLAVYLIKSSKK